MQATALILLSGLALSSGVASTVDQGANWEKSMAAANRFEAQGDYPAAVRALESALADVEASSDAGRIASTLDALGSVAVRQGRYFDAERDYKRSL
jgi:tetratricopeptide (TPR) repeat protein